MKGLVDVSDEIDLMLAETRKQSRKQTLEEVLKDIHYAIQGWKVIKKKEPLWDTAKHMLTILYNWQKVYEQKLRELSELEQN